MKIKVEALPERSIVYLSSARGYEINSIYETWDKLNRWAAAQGLSDAWDIRFALCHSNPAITPEEKCRYDAAIVVDATVAIVEPFQRSTLPAGNYAMAYYKDVPEKINNFMTEICSKWVCNSGYEPDNLPPLFNYLNVSRDDEIVEMNVYIKLKDLADV